LNEFVANVTKMSVMRDPLRSILGAGLILAACAGALVAHGAIAAATSAHILPSDYGAHPHGALPLLFLLLGTAGGFAGLMYLLHVSSTGPRSLPTLARACRSRLTWRIFPAIVVASCAVLMATEFVEQASAGHVDGVLSAFSDVPTIGVGIIAMTCAFVLVAARAILGWLIETHAAIATVLWTLVARLQPKATSGLYARLALLITPVISARATARRSGKRAPPLTLAGR
jgi:hypothetical protein